MSPPLCAFWGNVVFFISNFYHLCFCTKNPSNFLCGLTHHEKEIEITAAIKRQLYYENRTNILEHPVYSIIFVKSLALIIINANNANNDNN